MMKASQSEIQPHLVLEAIFNSCQGRENAMSGPELVEMITGKRSATAAARRLRQVVSALRGEGYPICARPEHGYYWATSVAEMEDTRKLLFERAMCSLRVAAWIKNMAIPALAGQLSLPLGEERSLPVLPEVVMGGVEPLAIELDAGCWQSVQDWLQSHPGYNPNKLINDALTEFLKFRGGM